MRKNIKKVAKIGVTGLLAAGLLVGLSLIHISEPTRH